MSDTPEQLPQNSLPAKLYAGTLQRVIDTLGLKEVHGEDGGAYLPLVSQLPMVQGEVGAVRVFDGGPLFRGFIVFLTG